jgi:C4-dicarboxylate-specific signal transduction histidine kinase
MNRTALVAAVIRGTVHAVNNILQTIGGQAEMLAQRPPEVDETRRRCERITTQTTRAAGLLRELSALTRDVPGAPDRADIKPCLERTAALREYDHGRSRTTFSAAFDQETVPPVRVDAPALTMMLLNLVLNAEQNLTDVPDARIDVAVRVADGRVRVAVTDNGLAMAAERRPRVFELPPAGAATGPTLGLGLPATRYLAEQHGGRLTITESPAGTGNCVELDLPALA